MNDCLRISPFWLDYECLLFCCDWHGSDLRVGHFYECTACRLKYDCLLTDWLTLSQVKVKFMLRQTVSRPVCLGIKHPRLLNVRWHGNAFCTELVSRNYFRIRCCADVSSDPLPSNGCHSTFDSVTSGTYLPNRCLAMVIYVTIYFGEILERGYI
jgi:hypothetical protein